MPCQDRCENGCHDRYSDRNQIERRIENRGSHADLGDDVRELTDGCHCQGRSDGDLRLGAGYNEGGDRGQHPGDNCKRGDGEDHRDMMGDFRNIDQHADRHKEHRAEHVLGARKSAFDGGFESRFGDDDSKQERAQSD